MVGGYRGSMARRLRCRGILEEAVSDHFLLQFFGWVRGFSDSKSNAGAGAGAGVLKNK